MRALSYSAQSDVSQKHSETKSSHRFLQVSVSVHVVECLWLDNSTEMSACMCLC